MEGILIILGTILGLTILVLYGAFSWGFVLYKFWHWFVLPAFVGVPAITIPAAIGLTLVIGLFHRYRNIELEVHGTKIKEKPKWAQSIFHPWVVLGLGWFIHLFI